MLHLWPTTFGGYVIEAQQDEDTKLKEEFVSS